MLLAFSKIHWLLSAPLLLFSSILVFIFLSLHSHCHLITASNAVLNRCLEPVCHQNKSYGLLSASVWNRSSLSLWCEFKTVYKELKKFNFSQAKYCENALGYSCRLTGFSPMHTFPHHLRPMGGMCCDQLPGVGARRDIMESPGWLALTRLMISRAAVFTDYTMMQVD